MIGSIATIVDALVLGGDSLGIGLLLFAGAFAALVANALIRIAIKAAGQPQA